MPKGKPILTSTEGKSFFPRNHLRRLDHRFHKNARQHTTIQAASTNPGDTPYIAPHKATQVTTPEWSKRDGAPTHFFSLRILPSSAMRQNVAAAQSEMVQYNPMLKHSLVSLDRLHLTTGVFSLSKDKAIATEQLQRVKHIMNTISKETEKFPLDFKNVGMFGKRVAFVRVNAAAPGAAHLTALQEKLQKSLATLGVDIKGNPQDVYTPHVTFAKITPKAQEEGKIHEISRLAFVGSQYEHFGTELFSQLDLCTMKGSSNDGYYKLAHQSVFGQKYVSPLPELLFHKGLQSSAYAANRRAATKGSYLAFHASK